MDFVRSMMPAERTRRKLDNILIDLNQSRKHLDRQAKKLEDLTKASKAKLKAALEKRDLELAKVHAESAIRNKHMAQNFHRMSGRVDAVIGRMKEARAASNLNKDMSKVVNGLAKALSTMTPENMATKLQSFEDLNETLGVNMDFMDMTIGNAVGDGNLQGEAQNLMEEIADTIGMEISNQLGDTAGMEEPVLVKKQTVETEDREAEKEI